MKNLILFSLLLLFTASCKKNKTTKSDENNNFYEKKVLKKLRVEFNMIKGDYKNFDIYISIGLMHLQNGISFAEAVIIKPANLDFTEKKKLTGDHILDVHKGKVEKLYIIESKEPVQDAGIAFAVISKDDNDKETPGVEIKIFADGKQIKVVNYTQTADYIYSEYFEMEKY